MWETVKVVTFLDNVKSLQVFSLPNESNFFLIDKSELYQTTIWINFSFPIGEAYSIS